ncbi:CAP domain-containing protein [Streptomyces sp. NPDC059698]|uniref:CAP domain-containing protein n=1 Tax=unclassified Streptomyces TaxID=2593676 RepID=UPI00093F4BC2|nr:CAP domain-containing protein [Streptomyces sp. CB02366]OKJ32397.1 SCP-like extracellular [Streptomyces sp. CB02366]WSS57976.1 CAP domain-containing protein [Streptomyces sp. NBC_01178]
MGRHRRSAAGPAAEESAADAAFRRGGTRRKKSGVPARAGLLGVSAAVAVGAVAVASGLLPGGDASTSGTTRAVDQVRSGGAAPDLLTQGSRSTEPADRSSSPARGGESPRPPGKAPSKTPSTTAPPSADPSKTAPESASPSEAASGKQAADPSRKSGKAKAPAAPGTSTPPTSKAPAPPKTSAAPPPAEKPSPSPTDASARSQVLALVNQERAKAGCSPLSTSAPLTSLAQDFSEDMAARGFFDHTDPDGDTPWDRAAQAGVQGLGAENIARGQAGPQEVMDAWMNSEGHRTNVLNCDYKTIGIGVQEGPEGPWWVQSFGF